MTEPTIAIIGSVRREITGTEAREAAGRETAAALGRALAEARLRIMVYSSDPKFVETDVVRGYVEAAPEDGADLIEVHFPLAWRDRIDYADAYAQSRLFRLVPHGDEAWQSAFYQSLGAIDGMLAIGGARSTLVSGGIALNQGLPIVAIPRFGGEAERIWDRMRHVGTYEPMAIADMAAEDDGAAARLATYLCGRCEARRATEEAEAATIEAMRAKAAQYDALIADDAGKTRRLWLACAAFAVLLALMAWALPTNAVVFMAGLVAAGAAGASVRMVWRSAPGLSAGASALLGAVAGFVLGLLYLLPMWNQAFEGETFSAYQFTSATVFALIVGIGFDAAMEKIFAASGTRAAEALERK